MLIALDFETTGLDSTQDEPLQIGMLCMTDDFTYVDHYTSLIKPSKEKFKHTISLITGFSSEDFLTAPTADVVFAEVVEKVRKRQEISKKICKNPEENQEEVIFVGHNVLFDLEFFVRYIQKLGFSIDFKAPPSPLVFDSASRCFHFPLFENYKGLSFIDTYQLSQTLIHFAGSYSLEVLKQTLMSDETFSFMLTNLLEKVQGGENAMSFHNALYDCVVCMCLYRFCYDRLQHLTRKYLLSPEKQKDKHSLAFPKQPNEKQVLSFFLPTSLPLVSKPLPTKKKLIKGKENEEPGRKNAGKNRSKQAYNSSFFDTFLIKVSNVVYLPLFSLSLDKVILETIREDKKTILAFSHSYKIDICKKIYKSFGYEVGFFNDKVVIDKNRFFLRLTKGSYTRSEVFFLYKYLSHVEHGYSVFDATNEVDKRIMMFLQMQTNEQAKDIILTTHAGLYHMIESTPDAYKDYRIFFFDADWWYTTYNNFSNNFINPYSVLEALERMQYIYAIFAEHRIADYQRILCVFDRLVNAWVIRMGVFFIEASALCSHCKKSSVTIPSLFETPAFFRTRKVRDSLWSYIEKLRGEPDFEHKNYLLGMFEGIYSLCKKPLCIEAKTFGTDGLYFTIRTDVTYTDFSEFLDFLRGFDVVFCSHSLKGKGWVENAKDETRKRMHELVSISLDTCQKKVRRVASVKELIEMVNNFDETADCFDVAQQGKQEENLLTNTKKGKNIFILSGIKQNSHEIITVLHQAGFCQKWTLLGENITGGRKKNIIKAFSSDQSKVVIGGFHFLLGLISEGRQWDLLVIYQTMGHMEEVMLDDICWYSIGFQNATKTLLPS